MGVLSSICCTIFACGGYDGLIKISIIQNPESELEHRSMAPVGNFHHKAGLHGLVWTSRNIENCVASV